MCVSLYVFVVLVLRMHVSWLVECLHADWLIRIVRAHSAPDSVRRSV